MVDCVESVWSNQQEHVSVMATIEERLDALEKTVNLLKTRDDIGFVRQLRMLGQIGNLLKDFSNIQADIRFLKIEGNEPRFDLDATETSVTGETLIADGDTIPKQA